MPFDPSTARPADSGQNRPSRFNPTTARPDPVLSAIDEAYPRAVMAGAASADAREEAKANAAPFMGVFSNRRPATEVSGNPGVAGGVAQMLRAIKNLAGGDQILDGIAAAMSIPEPIRNFAKVARNATFGTIDRELANYEANFSDSTAARVAEGATGMLQGLGTSAGMPNATYAQQILNAGVSGYVPGGPIGALLGMGTAGVAGAPETVINLIKRHVAQDPTLLRSIMNPLNQDAAANAPINAGPNFARGQDLERRLAEASGKPVTLTIGQKTQNPDILAVEQRLMSSGQRLSPSLELLRRQNDAMRAEAERVIGGFGDDATEAAAGAGARNAAQQKLQQLRDSREQAWNWNMVSDEGPGANMVNTTSGNGTVSQPWRRPIPDLPEDMHASYGGYLGSKVGMDVDPTTGWPVPPFVGSTSARVLPLGAQVSSAEQGLVLRNYRDALQRVLNENKVKLTTAEMDAVVKEVEKRIAQASAGTGNPLQVQGLLRQATEEAHGGGNVFQDMETAAARRVSGIIKSALESVIEQGKTEGNRFAGRLMNARDAFNRESMNIEHFENSALGKELANAKTDEDVVRLIIKNKNPSLINSARRYIEDVNPGAWGRIQRTYGEMMLGAGERRATPGYSTFGPREFITREPVRGDVNAPAETSRAVEEEILMGTPRNPADRFGAMERLYEDAGILGQLREPLLTQGSNDMTRISQIAGTASGGVTNPVGAAPFIARAFTDPVMGRYFYRWLMTPEGQQALMNPALRSTYGAESSLAGALFPALQGAQQ